MFAKTPLLPGRTWKSVFTPALRQRPIPHPPPDNDYPSVQNSEKDPTFSVKHINPALELPQQSRQTWGKRYILYLLVGLFISLAVALLLIWHFNTRNHGFPVLVDNHYTWTYGPTAILVLVVSVWRQVDHHYKLLAPWTTLERGAALAKHSLLLDYISPIQLTSFWSSLRNGHLSVTFTILGFVILKIITLVSTGLLVEESVVLPGKPAELQLATKFNGHLYNETEYVTKSDASLVYTAYGVLAGGLENQPGLTDALVYQNFRTPAIEPRTEAYITAEVDAFIPEFNCEPATVSINPLPYGANGSRSGDTIIIVNPSCVMMGGEQPTFVLDVSAEICPARQLRGVIQRVNCSMDDAKSQFPNRQLLTLVEVEYNQTVANSTGIVPDITSFALGIKRVKSLLCRPGYRTGRISLTHHVSKNGVNVTVDRLTFNDARIPGFIDEDLASMFTASLSDAANMFGDLSDSRDAEEFPSTLFKVMAAPFGSQYTVLFDAENNMRTAADLAFQQISVQIIAKNIVDTDQDVVDGSIILTQRRVIVNYASLWILVGGFIGMSMITLLLFKVRKKQLTYFNLATIHGFAQITALSPQLQKILRDIAVTSQRNVSAQLARYHFFSTTTGQRNSAEMISISAALRTSELQDHSNGDSTRPAQTWWNPLITRRLPMGIILSVPVVVIAVLEILQVHSDSERGLLTLTSSNNHLSNAYSRFIPALAMFSVATLFNAIEFNISVLAPFNAMYGAGAPSYRSIRSSLIDKSPPVAMLVAARSRHFAALSSSAAAVIGSVLTIVVSGLFTIEQSSRIDKILATRLETFDLAWPDSAINDRSAAVFTSLTESLNLSYPQNTYDELTFPDLSIRETTSESQAVDAAELRLTVPAIRANLDCSSLESSDFNVSASYNQRISSASATVEAKFPMPPQCLFGGPAETSTSSNSIFASDSQAIQATSASCSTSMLDLTMQFWEARLGRRILKARKTTRRDVQHWRSYTGLLMLTTRGGPQSPRPCATSRCNNWKPISLWNYPEWRSRYRNLQSPMRRASSCYQAARMER